MKLDVYRRVLAGETLTAILSPRALWKLKGPDAARYLNGQVTNDVKLVEYGIDIRRVVRSKVALGIAEGFVKADGKVIFEAKDLRVGLFADIGKQ